MIRLLPVTEEKNSVRWHINFSCAPRRRAINLTGGKPVCEGLTNQQ